MAEAAAHVGGRRNIVILGKTGAGKSTLANKIICCSTFKIGSELQRVTQRVTNAVETVNIEGKEYAINLIDTIGLRDSSTKSDSEIMKEIKRELSKKEGLNLIIFVFKHNRFTREESRVFKIITDNFTDAIQDFSLLVITHCERKNPTARAEIIKKFREDALTRRFGAMMKKGIYCVGLPDIKELNEQEMPIAMEEMKDDMIPIHKAIAEAGEMLSQDQMLKKSFWKRF